MSDAAPGRTLLIDIRARDNQLPVVELDRYIVTERFEDMLASENARFNREKFIAAAVWGIEERRHSLIPLPPRRRIARPDRRSDEVGAGPS